jgi:uncharacterized protein YciI
MQFLVILGDKRPGGPDPDQLSAHVDHLRGLAAEGALVTCGPLGDGQRAIQIFRAASLDEVRAHLSRDPFVVDGYYGSHEIQEFIEGNEANNWLMGPRSRRS